MFLRLYELSELLGVNQFPAWELLNHGMEEQYDRGFAISFDGAGDYIGIKTIFSSKGIGDRGVVYVPGPGANSPPLTPCARLSAKMETKIKYLFQCTADVGKEDAIPEGWKQWFNRIAWQDRDLQKRIVVELNAFASEAGVGEKRDNGKTRSGYCFPARHIQDRTQPVYELDAAKDLMVRKAMTVWKTYDKKSVSSNGVCSVCGREAQVFGNFSELKCYSLDKPGLITGGFQYSQASRNFPVCEKCAFSLSFAIRYVLQNLSARMAGRDYLVLPYCSGGKEIREYIKEELAKRPARFSIDKKCDLLVNFDDELLAFMHEENLKEQLAFALVFFREKQKEWKIQAEVQQVLPGRMKDIQQAKGRTEKDPLLVRSGKDENPARLTAETFHLFARAGGQKAGARTFYQWMAAVFEGGAMNRRFLVNSVIKTLLATARKDPKGLHYVTCQAWALFLFCSHLDLMEQREDKMTTTFSNTPYGQYMSNHPGFFGRKEVAAAFLSGCYVKAVCDAQKKEREMKPSDQAPFAKKFQGRLLSRNVLQRLFREGHDKLSQYKRLWWVTKNDLEKDLAGAWVECEDRWEINDEEATFAFTVGYSLARHIVSAGIGDDDDQQQEERQ